MIGIDFEYALPLAFPLFSQWVFGGGTQVKIQQMRIGPKHRNERVVSPWVRYLVWGRILGLAVVVFVEWKRA